MSDQLIFTEDADRPERTGARTVAVLLLILLALAGGGYYWAWSQAKDRIPRGTTIEDVRVGGLSRAAALTALEDGLGDRATKPVEVTLASTSVSLSPSDSGLAVDYEASVDEAGAQRSWRPGWLWDYFTGGDNVRAVVRHDDERLDEALEELAADIERAPVDGRVRFRDGAVVVRDSATGLRLDREAARAAVVDAYLTDEVPELPLRSVDPDIDQAEVDAARRRIANPAVSGPVTLRFGRASARLRPRQYLPALTIVARDGDLVLRVDRKRLRRIVDRAARGSGTPTNARVVLRDGRPRVVPARVGVTYRPDSLVRGFTAAVTAKGDERTQRVRPRRSQPQVTTKDARRWGVKERVSTFTTYYPHADYRNVNLGRAAELINGTVLKPGQTFSLNDTVGERTRANGFTDGYIISNGILEGDLGGGVSQIATTTFNAAFFAGLKDVEHKPHSFYIDRYPVGREATVAWGAVDLRFKNTTPYGVLIQASVRPSTPATSGVVTVTMWSTKYWDITTRTGDRYNITEPETRYIDDLECHENEGYGGFDIDIWRYFRRHSSGRLVRTEKMHTRYIPSDSVECTNPDAIDPIS